MSSNDRYNLQKNSDLETLENFKILISNIKSLKDKTWGCPWQKIQSHKSLIPFLHEESNEFIDAIYEKKEDNICEELGDLLLQVMLHAEIGYEEKEFTLNDVIKNLNKKIINRHPYIFNKKEKVSLKKSQQIWENIKNSEKETPHMESSISKNLNMKIKNLPPMIGTDKITNVVKEYGFKWESTDQIFEKLEEEINELKEAIKNKNDSDIKNEFGDILSLKSKNNMTYTDDKLLVTSGVNNLIIINRRFKIEPLLLIVKSAKFIFMFSFNCLWFIN